MKRVFVAPLILILVLLLAITAAAQPPGPPGGPEPGDRQGRIRERIETMRMWRLTKALDLDQNTSARLFPVLNKYGEKRMVVEKELRNDMWELRALVDKGNDSGIGKILQNLETNHKSMQKIKDDEWNELKGILSVRQQAQFLLFQIEFERELQRMISEARDRRPGGDFDRDEDRPFRPRR